MVSGAKNQMQRWNLHYCDQHMNGAFQCHFVVGRILTQIIAFGGAQKGYQLKVLFMLITMAALYLIQMHGYNIGFL